MGLCVLYYVEYSLYNVKKWDFFFYLGWNYTLTAKFDVCGMRSISLAWKDSVDRSKDVHGHKNTIFVEKRKSINWLCGLYMGVTI